MTARTFTPDELAARDAAIRSAALAEAVKWHTTLAKQYRDRSQDSEFSAEQQVECMAKAAWHEMCAGAIGTFYPTPPGMVCVPVEPTEARIRAGALAILGRSPQHLGYQEMALAAYRAFISHGGKE